MVSDDVGLARRHEVDDRPHGVHGRTIATQIHLFAKTSCSTGRRYRSTRAITSSVIWRTANTPRATRPHTGTEDNNESITYALSPRHLARHAKSDGPSGRHGWIGQFVPQWTSTAGRDT